MTDKKCVCVMISYRKKRHNHRLIFGRPRQIIRRGWHRQLAIFHDGDIFGYERWTADKFGTQNWSFIIAKGCLSGGITVAPGIHPGAEILACAKTKSQVKRLLSYVDDAGKTHPELCHVPADLWRQCQNALQTGTEPWRLTPC